MKRYSDLTCLAIFISSGCLAGTGVVRTEAGTKFLDFLVSVRFNASQAQIDAIKTAFTDANVVLADACDGEYRFGRIKIANNSGCGARAEVWVHPGAGRAHAQISAYGLPGFHINLFIDSDFGGVPALEADAYSITHEFAHHLWGLADEYKGPSVTGFPAAPAECEALPHSATADYSLMDNFFELGGNKDSNPAGTGTYTLNELCVESNHDPNQNTHQHAMHGKSCRQTMAEHPTRPVPPPVNLPIAAPPAVSDPIFIETPAIDRRIVLCIDRSGSMGNSAGSGSRSKLDLAKQAATNLIELLRIGDSVGVVSYSSTATVDYPLTTIEGDAQRQAAIAAIQALDANGTTCSLNGLNAAKNEFLSRPGLSCDQTLMLLGDTGDPAACDPQLAATGLIEFDISVLAVAIGQLTATELIPWKNLATLTAGEFFWLGTAGGLPPLFAVLSEHGANGGAFIRAKDSVTQGGTTTSNAPVDEVTDQATFIVTWLNTDDDLKLTLQSPTGVIFDAEDAEPNPDVQFIQSDYAEAIRVSRPTLETGTWIVQVHGSVVGTLAGGGAPNGSFEVVGTSDSQDVLSAHSATQLAYQTGDPVQFAVTPQYFGQPVLGASVSGKVPRPDGTYATVELVDTGDSTRGDLEANDGTYSAVIGGIEFTTTYSFETKVINVAGVTTPGEILFEVIGAPSASVAAAPFTRVAGGSFVVQTGDCNSNGILDQLDIWFFGTSQDCNGNGSIDACDINSGQSIDLNLNGLPDECEDGPINDNCANAIVTPGSIPFSNINATNDGFPHAGCQFGFNQQIQHDVWFDYVAPCTGDLRIGTCFSANFNTRIAVYEGCGCVAIDTPMACADDTVGCETTSQVTILAELGHCYKIRVGSKPNLAPPHPQGSGLLVINMICDGVEGCPGDVTYNGEVDVDDLLAVINSWGLCPIPPSLCPADVAPTGGNGKIDVDDMLMVINGWGPCPGS